MKNRTPLLYSLLFIVAIACGPAKESAITYNSSKIHYQGRVDKESQPAAKLIWSGTSATIRFKGTEVYATLKDEAHKNFYNVLVDRKLVKILQPDTSKSEYLLAENLTDSIHELQLFRRSQYTEGITSLYGFRLGKGGSFLEAPKTKEHKILFYGNSITAGHGVEDTSGRDRSDSIFTNNYLSYSAITARNLNAEYSCICRSGIGIMISWFPEIMPEIYDRLDPRVETSKWDFSQYQPDVVVVNLLQNDSWLVNHKKHAEFKHRFGTEAPTREAHMEAYTAFIQTLRSKYPNAHIVCMLGNMDITRDGSEWPGYVQDAVTGMNDANISTFVMPYKNTGGHPRVKEQEAMATGLTQHIRQQMNW